MHRGVAHLVERLVWDQEARSSSLRTSTNKKNPNFIITDKCSDFLFRFPS